MVSGGEPQPCAEGDGPGLFAEGELGVREMAKQPHWSTTGPGAPFLDLAGLAAPLQGASDAVNISQHPNGPQCPPEGRPGTRGLTAGAQKPLCVW